MIRIKSGSGSHCGKTYLDANQICSDPEVSATLPERIKVSKGFVSKEQAKGRMVNVVKGLKLYKDILTDSELSKLSEFVNELRLAGQRGELSGETFISFNKQMKGCKREIIQLGVPLFQPTKDEAANNMEPIPPVLQTVIDQLVQWRLLPGSKKPTSCIIDFFDEDESSQPYFKPPHLDNPISTLLLSDTTMAFGRVLTSDPQGNYKGSFTLPVQRGSLLVMRGNSADMARHVVCPSSNKRVCITFIKVKPPNNQTCSDGSLVNEVSQPGIIGYGSNVGGSIATWGPVIMLEPPKTPNGINIVPGSNGTGVFLPWSPGPKKFVRHLPPRIQKRRLPYLPTIMV
ncbi:Clavaminate synthase-like protein [Dioscorea alata]|uniref:Clavaminate synthase-like protein n=1 Tax=Dioscorea alata TaxID=55571 RepID=A0ACB7V102_DIOAL|nr:Clavaminate synthase-like protein [Dioscorea alata]